MFFILPGILLVGVVAVALWWLFFRAAVRHERTVQEARRREASFERLLSTPSEPLYCISCRELFRGPLEDHGCPNCHIRAFVIPARASEDPAVAERAQRLPAPQSQGEEAGESLLTPRDTAPPQQSQEIHPQ